MRSIKRPDGGVTYAYSYRDVNGKARNLQTTVYSSMLSDHIKAQAEIVEKAEKRSLKSTDGALFEELVDLVVKKNNGSGQPWIYNEIKKRFTGIQVNLAFVNEYNDYLDELEDKKYSDNSISHRKNAIRTTLNYAYKKSKIDSVPVRDWDISFKFRSRVWMSDQERLKFFNKMIELKSHLYWSMLLLEKRAIRARSDLWRLTDDNLELFGDGAPYLHYVAKKTDTEKNAERRETIIPLHGLDDILDYLKHGRPKDCPLLFPHIKHTKDSKGVFDFEYMRNAEWEEMGIPKKHFNYICEKTNIVDLHIHDFKHIAMKHMIENEGFTIEQIVAFGIQFNDKLIKKVYWQKNAIKMIAQKYQNPTVVSDCVSVEASQ